MAKVALLIGVSEYQPGLPPLPGAVKDVEAMQRILTNPEMGGFAEADVTVLKNPQRQAMEAAIEQLFNNRQKDDLVLLYFSGHGIKDERGKLYLSTLDTRKQKDGKLVKTSAVTATMLHENINDGRSERQVLILDCCFSGAIAQGMTVKDDGTVNVESQLGGKGRAILTSSTSTQYSFEQEGAEEPTSSGLSVYTQYLVEGIEKGAADQDGDGWISIDELHEYVSKKVTEAAPAMTPKFFPVEEGHKILLAKSPKDDPRLKYRKEVETRINNRGNFSIPARHLLNSLRSQLNLTDDIALAIEAEVQQPYREYQRKLKEYEETLVEAVEAESKLSEATLKDLRDYQQHLKLRDEDVAPIEERIIDKQKAPPILEQPPIESTADRGNQFEFDVVIVNAKGEPSSRSRSQATFFTEDLGNGVALEMVEIPGGQFMMGSPESELERLDREGPQHNVTIQPFYMGKFPVTQAQWAAVASLPKVNIDLDGDPSKFKGANRPVELVSWYDAIEFCARLSNKTEKSYRLPSEAEWEYACRAGTTTPFHFGETITTDLANYRGTDWTHEGTVYKGNYGQAPKGAFREQTTNVGSFGVANAFGLYDMHGNVWEWCQDTPQHENYEQAPIDGSAWLSDNDNQHRLLRGGSWYNYPRLCRSACRSRNDAGGRDYDIGFRVVCAAEWTS